jgi:hypothetical protein
VIKEAAEEEGLGLLEHAAATAAIPRSAGTNRDLLHR